MENLTINNQMTATTINHAISDAIKAAGLTPVSYLNQVDSYGYFKHIHTCQELEQSPSKIYGEFGVIVYDETFEWEFVQYDSETDEETFEVLEEATFSHEALNKMKSDLKKFVEHINK